MSPTPSPVNEPLIDVLVIGAGHAGCEAAFAAARMGCATTLVTSDKTTLGLMPCNPAVGGLAKSHLVVELDALGGEMGFNADLTGLQYRTLNASRGPAVRATRVQCDKAQYTARLSRIAATLPHLTLLEGTVTDLLFPTDETPTETAQNPIGVVLSDGRILRVKTFVFTSGTAFGGRIWVGHNGRDGAGDARPAVTLPESLQARFPTLQWRRLKTGTPPRILNSSVDWEQLEAQPGEFAPVPFFSRRMRRLQKQIRSEKAQSSAKESKNAAQEYSVPRGTMKPSSVNTTPLSAQLHPECSTNATVSADVPRGTSRAVSFGASGEPTSDPVWQQVDGFATYRPISADSATANQPLEDEMCAALARASALQIPCYRTHTQPETHAIIRENLAESALYGGEISGEGVRYCPSIEDKIVKFGDRGGHHVILEPEGSSCPWCYPNGLSNSLPESVQLAMVRSVPGLSRAEFAAPAYAIEYDCIDSRALDARLALKAAPNLFFAGQINGTTGYEEAAAQGFYAGVNAALQVQGREPLLLSRDEAYIGVMVDDLITKGTDEPYRMFTSRAERRLLLRPGDAHLRLHAYAKQLGIVSADLLAESEAESAWLQDTEAAWKVDWLDGNGLNRWRLLARDGVDFAMAAAAQKGRVGELLSALARGAELPSSVSQVGLPGTDVSSGNGSAEVPAGKSSVSSGVLPDGAADGDVASPLKVGGSVSRSSDGGADGVQDEPSAECIPAEWQEELALRAKYEGYIAHEAEQAERLKRDAAVVIPPGFDYAAVRGLRFEAQEKLTRIRPDSLRRASSIPGVNPADIALLSIALKRAATE